MLTIKQDTGISYNFIANKYTNIPFEQSLFFDIETTGFTAKNTKLYLIGCLYADKSTGHFISVQWFLDNYNDEAALIKAFADFSKDFTTLIHFNGQGFDIPYMEAKCQNHNIPLDFSAFNHIDIYKCASKIKNLIKTENLKQKTLENFMGLDREDMFSGGDLIAVYHDYMERKDDKLFEFLLLHNYEDIKGMLTVLDVLSYTAILEGEYTFNSIFIDVSNSTNGNGRKEAIIECTLTTPVPKRVSCSYDEWYMTAFDNKLKLKIDIYTDELKYFYPEYKDYYYLPVEDRAIHKSVAFYVDKNYRVRAKAANCYSKKSGAFMPQHDEIVTPYFKREYNDKKLYFEATDEFLNNDELVFSYAKHIVEYLMKVK